MNEQHTAGSGETRGQETAAQSSGGLIFRLSMADLRHEWILTACLMLAIAAVIAPLLLLFGLKFGTIETLRHRLIQDPKNREIRPMTSASFSRDWFADVSAREDVAFVIPMTRQISASVLAWVKGDGEAQVPRVDMDMVPTGLGDALILENGSPIPGDGGCVLTSLAAESLGAGAGDVLVVQVARTRGSRRETAEVELAVAGVVSLRAGAMRAVYVPLSLLEDVESFRDGQGVPERGWPGLRAEAYPLYDGVAVTTPGELSNLMQRRLSANTGFTKLRPLAVDEQRRELGYELPGERRVLLLHTEARPAGAESITAVETQLRGYEAVLLPWVRGLKGDLIDHAAHEFPVRLSILPAEASVLETVPAPPWSDPLAGGSNLLVVAGSAALAEATGGNPVRLRISNELGSVTFPVRLEVLDGVGDDTVFLQTRLGGMLKLAESRPIRFDEEGQEFLLYRRGYAGFRLYARRIEDVEGLRRYFEAQSIPVSTEAEKIGTVIEMDRYLTLIFWLVAAVGIAGSIASLLASLYASVERKKKELSVLRLIGLSGGQLYRFPVYQGAFIAAGGFAIALGMFLALATTINRLFASHLQAGESFCRLPAGHVALAWTLTVLVASLAAVAAVLRLARIDPAEALRDE